MIKLIACINLDRAIGYKNDLLYHIPNDLKRFKALTSNHIVCMGRKTFQSIGKTLPNRINVILSKSKRFKVPSNVFLYHSFEEVIKQYKTLANDERDLWVIGGQSIYEQALPYADQIYLTIVEDKGKPFDTEFPAIDLSDWQVEEHQTENETAEYPFHYVTYTRKNI